MLARVPRENTIGQQPQRTVMDASTRQGQKLPVARLMRFSWLILFLVMLKGNIGTSMHNLVSTTEFPQHAVGVRRVYYNTADNSPCFDLHVTERGCKLYATYACMDVDLIIDEVWVGPATQRMYETVDWCIPSQCDHHGEGQKHVSFFCTNEANTDLDVIVPLHPIRSTQSGDDAETALGSSDGEGGTSLQATLISTPARLGDEKCAAVLTTITDANSPGETQRFYAIQTPSGRVRLHDFQEDPVFTDTTPLTHALLTRGGGVVGTNVSTGGVAELKWVMFPAHRVNATNGVEAGTIALGDTPIAVKGPIPTSCHEIWDRLLSMDVTTLLQTTAGTVVVPVKNDLGDFLSVNAFSPEMQIAWRGFIGVMWVYLLLALAFPFLCRQTYMLTLAVLTVSWNTVAFTGFTMATARPCFVFVAGGAGLVLMIKTMAVTVLACKNGFIIPTGASQRSLAQPIIVCVYSIGFAFMLIWASGS